MPSNMPDARAVEEALRRAREMQGRSAHNAPPPPEKPTEKSPQGNAETSTEIPKEFQAAPNRPLSPLDTLLKDKERTLLLALLLFAFTTKAAVRSFCSRSFICLSDLTVAADDEFVGNELI